MSITQTFETFNTTFFPQIWVLVKKDKRA